MTKKKILIIGSNGYIGYEMFNLLKKEGFDVDGIDNYLRSDVDDNKNFDIEKMSYQNLVPDFLDQYTDCIWLAGHSSVKMSIEDENGALRNNLYDLISFSNLFRGRFIYASSGSVYSRNEAEQSIETSPNMVPTNVYDYTKISFDNYIAATSKKAIGLRFGTVNGNAKRLRDELMINSMTKSSIKNGYLNVMNPKKFRAVLYINDLVLGIQRIIESPIDNGIYNMASINLSIEEIAKKVSNELNADIKYLEDQPTYNFMMNASKFEETFNFKFTGTVEAMVQSFITK